MQLLERFESRIDRLVSGAFARAFKAEVQPVEIAAAVQREIDDHAVIIGPGRNVAPNIFAIDLSARDYERLMAFEAPMRVELAAVVREYATQQHFTLLGAVEVTFHQDPALETGIFRVNVEARGDDGNVEPASGSSERHGPHVIIDGFVHPLTRHTTRIGRGTDVDIRIDDAGVSRHHAEIVLSVPVVLRDLGSTNGTFVGGKRIQEVTLDRDTEIVVGPAHIAFRVK